MRFRFRALLLAPALPPLVFAAAVNSSTTSTPAWAGFVIVAGLGAAACYGATVVLLLPALFVASRLRPLGYGAVGAIAGCLGALLALWVTWVDWSSSGPNSGPPETRLVDHAVEFWTGPFPAFVIVGAVVVGLLYWRLSAPRAATA